jgi:hypothetical protein
MEYTRINMTLPVELLLQLDGKATELQYSRSAYIREAIFLMMQVEAAATSGFNGTEPISNILRRTSFLQMSRRSRARQQPLTYREIQD